MGNDSFLTRALDFLFKTGRHKASTETNASDLTSESTSATSLDNTAVPSSSKGDKDEALIDSSSKTDEAKTEDTLFTPDNVMKALGVEILENGGDGYYLVGFQGGVFVLSFEEERLNVMYNDVAECNFNDSVKAAFVANEINSSYAVWSCYLRTTNKGTPGMPIKICFSQMFALHGDFKETTQFIHGIMSSAFTVGREFRERFKKALNDNSNLANLLNQRDFIYKLELAKRMMEVRNFDDIKQEMPPASYLRIESLADLFDDTEFGRAQSLRILVNDQCEVINNSTKIEDFDIRDYIRKHPQREELDNITFIVSFEKQDLIINLKQMPGSSPKSLFFALNVMRSGVEDDIISHNRAIISCRDTIEIRLTTDQEDYWEVKYMVEEARDKHDKNDLNSLSDEQKMLLIQLAPNVQDDLYWGFKFFNEDCLFQSLFYLKRIFYNYCQSDMHVKNKEHVLADISLYIGIAYCQLKRYELAYYFLDKTNKYDSIIASEWYTNCLCSLKDAKALGYIRRMMETVTHNMEDNDTDPALREDLYKFYLFLKRRLVQTLINENRLMEAEELVKQMMDSKENLEFCKREIGFIRHLRDLEFEKNNKHDLKAHVKPTEPVIQKAEDVSDEDSNLTNDKDVDNQDEDNQDEEQ